MPKPRMHQEKMVKQAVKEEPSKKDDKVDEEKSEGQSQTGSQSSFSRASSSLSRARQKYEIVLKLVGMLILPVTMVVVLAFVVFSTEAGFTQDIQDLNTLRGYLRTITKITSGVQTERACTAIYLAHPDNATRAEMGQARNESDTSITEFIDYLNDHKKDLDKIFLYRASRCKYFIVEDIPRYRTVVDDLSAKYSKPATYAKDKVDKAQYLLTHGVDQCLQYVGRFPEFTKDGSGATDIINTYAILKAKELVALAESYVSSELATGMWEQEDRTLQDTWKGRADAMFQSFLGKATKYQQEEVQALLDGPYGQAWETNTSFVLNLPSGPIDDYLAVETRYFNAYSKFLSELNVVIEHIVDVVTSHQANTGYQVWLYTVLAVACCTPFLAFWAGRAIAKPFSKLETVKKKLKSEKTRHTMQSEALSKFVPFETLELLGLTDITQAEVGVSHIRRLTVKFTYIHNFSALASRLGADNIVSHLNQWVDGVLPHIQRNKGIIDKFMGDGMLIFYYKPEEAVKASIKMAEWLAVRNKEASITGAMPMNFGIGVNTGDVCIGTIGSEHQITTTTIGDEVNIASAMQNCCKMYETTMIVTEASKNFGNANSYSFRYLGHVTVKGRVEPVDLFEVLDCVDPEQLALKKQTNIMFQEGVRAYKEDNYAEAERNFQEVLDMNPRDACAKHYVACIEKGIAL